MCLSDSDCLFQGEGVGEWAPGCDDAGVEYPTDAFQCVRVEGVKYFNVWIEYSNVGLPIILCTPSVMAILTPTLGYS